MRLREKQRLRAQYGISEKQLRAAYEKGTHTAGQTGNAMLIDLETRLDAWSCVQASPAPPLRHVSSWFTATSSLTATSSTARPTASSLARPFRSRPRARPWFRFQIAAEGTHRDVLPPVPGYLDVNLPSLKATLTRKPEAEEIPVQVNIQYVVEFYAR